MGFIHVNTAELESADVDGGTFAGEQFTVARIKRSILEQSTVGAIYTHRSTGADPIDPAARAPKDQHTVGADLYYATARLFGDKNLDFQAFTAWNSNPDRGVDRSFSDLSSRGIRINYPNDIWSGRISYRAFGDHYDPAVGFVTRSGFRSVEPQIRWGPRPDIDWIRRLNFSGQFQHLEGITTGITELRVWEFTLFGVDFESQDNFNIGFERQFEYLDDSFEISDGILIDVGNYANSEWTLTASTASRRVVSGRVQLRRGGFWSGDRSQVELGLDFRPSAGILLSAEVEANKVDLPQGSFDANLLRVEGEWNITPLANITGNIQYDDVSEIVGLFMRTRWILTPGNEFFFVVTQNWQNLGDGLFNESRDFMTLSRGVSLKLNYTYRL